MKIIKVKDYEELSKMAADFVRNLLENLMPVWDLLPKHAARDVSEFN